MMIIVCVSNALYVIKGLKHNILVKRKVLSEHSIADMGIIMTLKVSCPVNTKNL
jgi:hypothetical protein